MSEVHFRESPQKQMNFDYIAATHIFIYSFIFISAEPRCPETLGAHTLKIPSDITLRSQRCRMQHKQTSTCKNTCSS